MYNLKNTNSSYAAVIGIDWAKDKNDFHVHVDNQEYTVEISSDPRVMRDWFLDFSRKIYPNQVAVISEQAKGLLVNCLSLHACIDLYAINTTCIAQYRKLVRPSMAKDDKSDAMYISNIFFEHPHILQKLKRHDCEFFETLTHERRKKVDLRSKEAAKLRAELDSSYPVIFKVFPDMSLYSKCFIAFLKQWPTMADLKDASRAQIGEFLRQKGCRNKKINGERIDLIKASIDIIHGSLAKLKNKIIIETQVELLEHLNQSIQKYDAVIKEEAEKFEQYKIFKSLPGAGDVVAARLLAFFTSDNKKFKDVEEALLRSEVAPVTQASGRAVAVKRRYLCNRFNLQTFTEFAQYSIMISVWAKAYYESRKGSASYFTIVRAIAFKWIRIIYRLLQTNQIYDEAKYLEVLKSKNVHYIDKKKVA